MTTTLQQAAQAAAKETFEQVQEFLLASGFHQIGHGQPVYDAFHLTISKYLAPVQSELDRLKKENQEAREIIANIGTTGCGCEDSTRYTKTQSWLERNK